MNAIIPGSITAISQYSNKSLAESFLSVDVLLLVDMSGSMTMNDAQDGKARHEVAQDELMRLQTEMPGKIGVISFSDKAEFCPSGVPSPMFGGTNMVGALQLVKPADGTGIRFILISDGLPDDAEATLRVARGFESKIDTIYIGPEAGWDSHGREFLEKLAACTGGQSAKSEGIALLAGPVRLLLEAGNDA